MSGRQVLRVGSFVSVDMVCLFVLYVVNQKIRNHFTYIWLDRVQMNPLVNVVYQTLISFTDNSCRQL